MSSCELLMRFQRGGGKAGGATGNFAVSQMRLRGLLRVSGIDVT